MNIGIDNTMKNTAMPNIPQHINNASLTNDAPPLTPKTKRSMGFAKSNSDIGQKELQNASNMSTNILQQNAPENSILPNHNIKQALMSAPCPCSPMANYENIDTNTNSQANKFAGPYNDYDVPRTTNQQVFGYIN